MGFVSRTTIKENTEKAIQGGKSPKEAFGEAMKLAQVRGEAKKKRKKRPPMHV